MFTGAALVAAMLLAANPATAQPPAGYYDTVDTTNTTTLRQTLHPVIDDHTRYPYTASTTDTWDILNLADEDPNNPSNIIDVYKNASYTKISGGVGAYNREHTWPKSYGFPDDGDSNSSYTDCHHLMLSDVAHNASRSNKPFRDCTAGCTEETTLFNDGRGGGSGVYPGNSNWTTGDFTQGTWETWNGRKGDVARAIFYMDIRYEGGTHGTTGFAEPDLIITDNESLIDASNTGNNESVAYMGMLSVLLQWHAQDPVDSREFFRNEVVYMFQGNRNPFIDHPEWVDCLHGSTCGGGGTPDTMPPAAPTGLAATGGDGTVNLTWSANGESDLAGYNVYRGTATGGPYTKLNGPLVSATSYSDATVTNGTTYFYIITAVDTSSNISGDSAEASATPQSGGGGGGGGNVILSEVFYDPSGTDTGLEWVELYNAGSTTVDLSGYSLGYGGTSYTYGLLQLAGSIAPGATFVVGGPTSSSANGNPSFNLAVDFNPDIQNSGSTADGVALFDSPTNQVNSTTVPVDAVIYGGANNNGLLDETGVANAPEVGDAPSNSSLERTDLVGSWQVQPAPTPNATPFSGGGSGGSGTVILSEVLYDISGTDTGLEWVELHNAGSTTVDLSGYSLGYGGTDYTYGLLQLAGSIAPGGTFVVGGPTSGSSNSNPSFNIAADFNPDIQNSGSTADGVALFDVLASQVGTTTVPVDAVLYGSTNSNGLIDETGVANAPEVGDASAGSSIERIDLAGGWQIQSSPTPNTTLLGGGGGGGGGGGNPPTTVTFTSIAGEDGWVRESSENSNVGGGRSSTSSSSSALRGGDNRSDRQYKGIISFDTSSIPSGATLVSATLRLRRGTKVGTSPFSTHGTCRVDIKTGGFGSSTALATEDFQAAATATQVASLSDAASNLDWSEGSLDSSGLAAVNTGGTTQLRFYFDLDDNDDRGNDYIGYYSGDNSTSANRPQLVITYQ
jgi:endonuclease I